MPEDKLSDLLSLARSAHSRFDTSRPELAFETRMQGVLRATAQAQGPAGRFHAWLRATVGLAAATGVVAFLFLTGRNAVEADDTVFAWWSGNSTAWDLQLFN